MLELLKLLVEQPIYVFMFLALAGFFWNSHKSSVNLAVQSGAVNAALALVASLQAEGNRLRDESTKQNERWLHSSEMQNERFLATITGQTGAITRQGGRLDTMDTSLSSLPKLAAAAEGSDAKTDLIVQAIQQSGADIQAVNKKLGYMAVDTKSIAQYLVNPTAPNKEDVQKIADEPTSGTAPAAAPAAVPAPPQPVSAPAAVDIATDSAAAKAAVAAVGAVAAATKTAAEKVEAANTEAAEA